MSRERTIVSVIEVGLTEGRAYGASCFPTPVRGPQGARAGGRGEFLSGFEENAGVNEAT